MQFTRRLHEGILQGDITCTVRIWKRLHVKVGGRYPFPPGHIIVDSIRQITIEDITPHLARQSGFEGVIDLLRTAKHGAGAHVYLITFHYQEPENLIPSMPDASTDHQYGQTSVFAPDTDHLPLRQSRAKFLAERAGERRAVDGSAEMR